MSLAKKEQILKEVLALKERVEAFRAEQAHLVDVMKSNVKVYQDLTRDIIRDGINATPFQHWLIRGVEDDEDPEEVERRFEKLKAAVEKNKKAAEEVRKVVEDAKKDHDSVENAVQRCMLELDLIMEEWDSLS